MLLALLAGAFYVGASAVPLVILRVEQRLRDFMALSIVDAVATPTLTVLLVVWQHDGIVGWLIAAAGSNAILLFAATRIVPWDRGARYGGELVRGAVRFGATLIPHAFALWALLLIDRAVLAGLVSARELGIYSLAATIAVPVAIAIQSLNQAMMPAYANAGINPGHRDHLADLIVVQITSVLAICLAGALLGGPLLQVMAPDRVRLGGAACCLDRPRLRLPRLVFHPHERDHARRRTQRLRLDRQRAGGSEQRRPAR